MNTVILCNQLGGLKLALKNATGPMRFIRFLETSESSLIRDYLHELPETEELPRAQLLRERSHEFRKSYLDFMSRLNAQNCSRHWWAMSFTNKNPIVSPLCRDTSYFLLIVRLLQNSSIPLVVVTDSVDLVAQVRAWANGKGVRVVNRVRKNRSLKEVIKDVTPAGIVYYALLTLWIWVQVKRMRVPEITDGGHTVVTSIFHTRSLATPGKYWDPYFGKLVDELAAEGATAMVVGMLHERWREQLARLKALDYAIPVVPLERFLATWDLIKCGALALTKAFQPVRIQGPVEIEGIDLHCLIKRTIRRTHWSGSFFINMRVFYSAQRTVRSTGVARWLYPFENRAWEKMLISGVKNGSPETRTVGYQHACVTLSHLHFMMGKEESGVTPLPDVVLTTGQVVNDWLARDGNYPPKVVQTGCALRQSPPTKTIAKERASRLTRVLLTLATSIEEYINSLIFLEKAFAGSNVYELRIRPHPIRPLEPALNLAPLTRRDFYSQSTGSLEDDLGWADVVLYASTTVCMEAVSIGIPVIYLDLGDILDTDPMFGWSEFKWPVTEPEELIPTIQAIERIPLDRFLERQRKGRKYVGNYLTPVNAEALQRFQEA